MRKRVIAGVLSLLMIFMAGAGNTIAVSAKEAAEENHKETEEAGETDVVSEGTIDYIETEEDVPIITTDVPVTTIEWGDDGEEEEGTQGKMTRDGTIGESHDLVLVLDCSGSMGGTPMQEMKKACNNFVDDILDEDPGARIAIVGYASDVSVNTFGGSYFTSNRSRLRSAIAGLGASGGTAMNAGLVKADELLQNEGAAEHQYIIQMTDGQPNEGEQYTGPGAKYAGTSFVDPDGNAFTYTSTGQKAYCSEIYNTFSAIQSSYHIYSMGFFHSLSGTEKQFVATFLNDVQNTYYVEVGDANDITFSFEGIAEDINSEHIKLNMDSVNLTEGDHTSLIATLDGSMPEGTEISYGSSDTTVAVIDENGRITAKKAGTCTITVEAGGYSTTCEVTITAKPVLLTSSTYTVYQNENTQDRSKDDYKLCSGATIVYNGETYTTDQKGEVKLPDGQGGELTISKDGYTSRTISMKDLENGAPIYLQKDSDNPVINSVSFDGNDVLADDYAMSLTEADSTTVSVDVDWGNSSRKSIKLVQEAAAVEFEAEKNALTMVLKDRFDISKDLYILATDQNDHSVKKKLKISAEGGVKGLEGLSFSAGGSISLTVPDSVPLIKGKKVSLGLDNLEALPFTVSIDQGIVYVTFGVDIANYTKSNSKVTNKTTGNSLTTIKSENKYYFEKLENIKHNGIKDSIKDIKNLKARYKTQMKFPKGSFGFDADFTLLGYAKGYVDNDANFQWLDGGMVFNPSASASWSGQFAIGPVPCYWEAKIAGAIEAAISLYKNKTEKAATLMPEGSVEGSLSGSVGAGIGLNKVATIGGGATLKAEPGVTFYQNKENYLKCTFSGSLYFKVKLGIIEYKPESQPISCTIDNSPKRSAMAAGFSDEQSVMYDLSKYKVESLEYILDDSQALMASRAAGGEEEDLGYAEITEIINDNSYTTTNPKVVSIGTHTRLAVWLNTETTDVNDVQLYYSYYDGNGWSSAAKISDDSTFDYAPKVCAVNGKAYVIWQNAEQRFDTDVLESENVAGQLAEHMGITVAEFKTSDGSFTVTDLSSGSGFIDVQPVIAANGSAAAAYWVENTGNDWFGQNSKNTIYKAEYDGSGWSEEPEAIVSDANSICSMAAGYMDSGFHVAYTMDSDNNLADSSDTELYVDGTPVTGNDVLESFPVFEGGVLYWSSGGRIMSSVSLQPGDGQSILPDDRTIPTDVFKILSDGNRQAILYLQTGEDATSEIYGLVPTAEGWSEPIQITNSGDCISDFDALWLADGIELLCNMTTVNGLVEDSDGNQVIGDSTYGKTSLVRMNYSPSASLEVDGCYYEKSAIGAGCTLPVTVEVTNTGMTDFNGVKVEVLDTEGASVYSTELREAVGTGKTAELGFGYIVDKKDLGKTYTVKCTPLSRDGENVYGGDAPLELSYEDLKLTFANWGRKDEKTAVILAQAANAGFSALSNVTATLYKVEKKEDDGTDGEHIKTEVARIEKGSVKPGEDASLDFSVEYEQGAVYCLELTASEEEQDTANNSAYLYFEPARDNSGRTVSAIKAVKKVTEYTVGDTLDLSDLKVTASYEDGTISDIRSDCVIDTSGVKMNAAGTYLLGISYGKLKTIITIKVKNTTGTNGTSSGSNGAAIGTTVTKSGIIYEVKAGQGGKREAAVKKAQKSSLTKANIPSSVTIGKTNYNVTEIGANAFKKCKKLKSVSIGKNVRTIGASAFEGCISLKKVSIPSKVTAIGKKAFSKNSKLTDVTIGASVKSIGTSAFAGDKKLKKILVKSKKLKTIGKGAIKGISSKAVIKVPKTRRAEFQKLLKPKTGYRKTMKIKG